MAQKSTHFLKPRPVTQRHLARVLTHQISFSRAHEIWWLVLKRYAIPEYERHGDLQGTTRDLLQNSSLQLLTIAKPYVTQLDHLKAALILCDWQVQDGPLYIHKEEPLLIRGSSETHPMDYAVILPDEVFVSKDANCAVEWVHPHFSVLFNKELDAIMKQTAAQIWPDNFGRTVLEHDKCVLRLGRAEMFLEDCPIGATTVSRLAFRFPLSVNGQIRKIGVIAINYHSIRLALAS